MKQSTLDQFNALRLTLEVQVPKGSVVAIGSATAQDGSGFAAFGIADSLAVAGHRTLLLRAAGAEGTAPIASVRQFVENRRTARLIGDHGLWTTDVADERLTSVTARDTVGAALHRMVEEYAYVIVDAGVLPNRCLAMTLASLAEATLIALRSGRARTSEDTMVSKAIASAQVNVLGVVSTTRSAIDAFARVAPFEHSAKPRFIDAGSVTATV